MCAEQLVPQPVQATDCRLCDIAASNSTHQNVATRIASNKTGNAVASAEGSHQRPQQALDRTNSEQWHCPDADAWPVGTWPSTSVPLIAALEISNHIAHTTNRASVALCELLQMSILPVTQNSEIESQVRCLSVTDDLSLMGLFRIGQWAK